MSPHKQQELDSETEDVRRFSKKLERRASFFEWLYRGLVLCGLVAVLWLNGHYVSLETYNTDREKAQAEYKADKGKTDQTLSDISKILTTMQERDKVNDRQDETLKDHERRLRDLEMEVTPGRLRHP